MYVCVYIYLFIFKIKKPICKGYVLHNSSYMTFWKRQKKTMETEERLARLGALGGAWRIFRAVKLFHMTL